MPFSADYGDVNVQGSFNKFFQDNITAYGLPSWITGVSVYFDFPDQGLTAFPSFSVVHMNKIQRNVAQGRIVRGTPMQSGMWNDGLVDISCWASTRRSGGAYNNSAMLQMRSMRDMVMNVMHSASGIHIRNIYADTANPTSLSALIRIRDIEEMPTPTDPDPSIRRSRMLVSYYYLERW